MMLTFTFCSRNSLGIELQWLLEVNLAICSKTSSSTSQSKHSSFVRCWSHRLDIQHGQEALLVGRWLPQLPQNTFYTRRTLLPSSRMLACYLSAPSAAVAVASAAFSASPARQLGTTLQAERLRTLTHHSETCDQ